MALPPLPAQGSTSWYVHYSAVDATVNALTATTAPGGTIITTDEGSIKLNDSSRPFAPVSEIACFGHSVMYSDGGIVPTRIAALLGVTTYNLGIGGNTSTDIAIRAGGVVPLLTFAGGVIPPSTAAASVSVQPSREYLIAAGGSPFTYVGTVAGVPGTLTYATATQLWTFARTTAGVQTVVASGTPFLITSTTYKDRVLVIWPGRNNLYAQSGDLRNVIRDVDTIVGSLTPYRHRCVVLADLTTVAETSGTTNYNLIVASNADRAVRYGAWYYDVRRDFIDQGLTLAGITPTSGDLSAIAADTVPPSLMNVAGDHPNAAGYTVAGTLIAQFIASRSGWGFAVIGANKLTADQASFETSVAGWSGNSDGAIVVARTTAQASDGVASMEVTAGPSYSNVVLASDSPVAVTSGQVWAANVQTRAQTTARARQVEMYFYDSAMGFLSYAAGGTTVTDNTTGWTTHTMNGVAVPAGAAFVRLGLASVTSANGEKHYVDKAGIYQVATVGDAPPTWVLPV